MTPARRATVLSATWAAESLELRWPEKTQLTQLRTLCKVCDMSAPHTLQPTLWRTCRVLANRARLRMFGLLVQQPDQTVSAVAQHFNLPLPVASQYLRAMEARGLLTARRTGSRVSYRVSEPEAAGPVSPLLEALRLAFQRESNPGEAIFKLATAFTHPRRLALFRALGAGARTAAQLREATRISHDAVWRHLAKLEARGFVARRARTYELVSQRDGVARALARLASG